MRRRHSGQRRDSKEPDVFTEQKELIQLEGSLLGEEHHGISGIYRKGWVIQGIEVI